MGGNDTDYNRLSRRMFSETKEEMNKLHTVPAALLGAHSMVLTFPAPQGFYCNLGFPFSASYSSLLRLLHTSRLHQLCGTLMQAV